MCEGKTRSISRCCLVCNYQIKVHHSPDVKYQEVTVLL